MGFIVFVLVLVCNLIAYERVVLVEIFTSTTCVYCPAAEAAVDNVVAANPLRVAEIAYHVWWPSPGNDPFYLANPSESRAQVNYYGVDGTPTIFVDGTEVETSALSSSVNSRLGVSSPLQLSISFPGSNRVRGVIRSSSTISGNIRAFFVITESEIHYSAPNGRTIFNGVMRDIIPDTNGAPVTISPTDSVVLEYPYSLGESWELSNLKVVFFVQNRTTKAIYQAAIEDIPPGMYYFRLNALSNTRIIADPSSTEPVQFKAVLKNVGTENDRYKIRLLKYIPDGWSASLCVGSYCYDDSAAVDIVSGAVETLKVDLYTLGYEGTGKMKLAVHSFSSPELTDTLEFIATTGGCVLIVDDDQGDDFEKYYETALDSLKIQYFTLSRLSGNINSSTLMRFRAVVWFTGTPFTDVLSSVDRVALQTYLTNGGKLFLTGAEIGWSLTDTSSFYRNYLHAHYVADSASNYNVYGVFGDPISDGMSFRIFDGDGANNQRYPDVIQPRDSYATTIFTYGTRTDSAAGIRIETEIYKIVYLGFGFEAIDNFASRRLLMQRIMNFFGISSSTETRNIANLPEKFSVAPPYPNPFNSSLVLEFSIRKRGILTIEMFNVLGERILLYIKEFEPGEHRINPINSTETLTSGIYFIRLSFDGESKIVSVVFMK
ncbi:MAG: Omp28-related outer membrane protein [bacterium]